MSETGQSLVRREEVRINDFAPIFDIPLRIVVEVGRLRLRVREVVKLTVGSVIELKKAAGEPFDVFINGKPIARGEIVPVEQSTGVRIVEIQRTGSYTS